MAPTEIRLWHDQLLYKPAERTLPDQGTVNVGWHTDRQYWRTCASADMLTAWVPFHDVGEREGAVSFVDGSHRWDDDVVLDFFNPDLSTLDGDPRPRTTCRVVVAEIPRARPGQLPPLPDRARQRAQPQRRTAPCRWRSTCSRAPTTSSNTACRTASSPSIPTTGTPAARPTAAPTMPTRRSAHGCGRPQAPRRPLGRGSTQDAYIGEPFEGSGGDGPPRCGRTERHTDRWARLLAHNARDTRTTSSE